MLYDLVEAPGARPCPRCGHEVKLFGTVGADGKPEYKCFCEYCMNSGPTLFDEEWAIKYWNNPSGAQALPENVNSGGQRNEEE